MVTNIMEAYSSPVLTEDGDLPSNLLWMAGMVMAAIVIVALIYNALKDKGQNVSECLKNAGANQAAIEKCNKAYNGI